MALLIGDSIFARLLQNHGASYHPLSKELCVRGARVQAVKSLVKSVASLPSSVVVLIAINNLLSPHDLSIVWQDYKSFINHLLRRGRFVFVCQLLPVANIKNRI